METLVYGESNNGFQAIYFNSVQFKRSVLIYYSPLFRNSMCFVFFITVMHKMSALVGKQAKTLPTAGTHGGARGCVLSSGLVCRWRSCSAEGGYCVM